MKALWGAVVASSLPLWGFDPTVWNWGDTISLTKDQTAVYRITDIEQIRHEWTVSFRWTLYQAGGAVMLYDLNGFKSQNILYPGKPGQDTHTIVWRERKDGVVEKPTFWFVARSYGEGNKSITFDVYVRDKERQIEVKRMTFGGKTK